MAIRLDFQTEKKQGSLLITEESESNKTDVIRGFFSLFGFEKEPVQTTVYSPEIVVHSQGKAEEIQKQVSEAINQRLQQLEARPSKDEVEIKKPELINSKRTLNPTIGEMIGGAPQQEAPPEEPEWYQTGIKNKEGVPHYKLRYWCKNPQCRDRSNDYIKEDQKTVTCRKCGQELLVRQAADEHLKRDEWGNFFIADKLAP